MRILTHDNTFNLPKIEKFGFSITYSNKKPQDFIEGREQHIHNECEIYIHLSGDVSFMVEDTIYPVSRGSIIITRPNEYHHCIYNSDKKHEHFWILFSSSGNEEWLKLFFERDAGRNNLLFLNAAELEECIDLCHELRNGDCSDSIGNYFKFFKLLKLLESADTPVFKNEFPKDLSLVLSFVGQNFMQPITVKDIAEVAHMSVNTLERKFLKSLKTTPNFYLREKRLANAVKLLSKGESVTDSCLKSGFSDCSGFINLFKKRYGVTPLKYKQQIRNK